MPEIDVTFAMSADPPGLWNDWQRKQLVHVPTEAPIRMAFLEHGMISGATSVMMGIPIPGTDRIVIVETSLVALQMALAAARGRFPKEFYGYGPTAPANASGDAADHTRGRGRAEPERTEPASKNPDGHTEDRAGEPGDDPVPDRAERA